MHALLKPKAFSKLVTTIVVLAFMAVSHVAGAQNQPERVEPPFWWSDMYHNELQIMVYGEDIGRTTIEIDHPGFRLKEAISVNSPNYLFLYLDIANTTPGVYPIRFMYGGETKFVYDFVMNERAPGSRYREGLNASDAMYLLMPDRFANGDPSLDDQPGMLEQANRDEPSGRHGGDIPGIKNHLDFIAEMGFTAIWLNPVLENNQPRYSYHGYATTDYYKIDPRFGTNEDYRNLVAIAEEKGVKIIKD